MTEKKRRLKRIVNVLLIVVMCVMVMQTTVVNSIAAENQGTVSNKEYADNYAFTDYSITEPTAENFTTDIVDPMYTFTWYTVNGDTKEEMESLPKKIGNYLLKVDVSSSSNDMTASLEIPVVIEYADISVAATVEDKEFHTWDEVVLTAPEGYAIAHSPSKWDFSGNPKTMQVVDIRGAVAEVREGNQVVYYLRNDKGEISAAKTISIFVAEKNAPVLGVLINNNALAALDVETENLPDYNRFFKSPASINISGYKEYRIALEGKVYDEDSDWIEDEGIFEFSESGAYSIHARTVELFEEGYSEVLYHTEGFVIYKDSTRNTCKLIYTKETELDKTIKVVLNGNTVKGVMVGDTVLSEEAYELTDAGIVLKGTYLESLENGTYTITVSYNPCGREYVEADGNEAPNITTVELTVKGVGDNNVATTENEQYQLEVATGVTEVSESLAKNTNLDTVEKIEQYLKTDIQSNGSAITEENTEVYDVDLLVKNSEGGNWEEVTVEDFPQEGLKVCIAYPEGTNAETNDFEIAHMFTTDMNGYNAGDIEYPEVTKTEKGLTFTVNGLSPIIIGWKESKSDSGTTENKSSDDQQNADQVTEQVTEQKEMTIHKIPATGDSEQMLVWIGIGIFCMTFLLIKNKFLYNKE